MPTREQAHLCLIRDVGIFWLLRESVPLCLFGNMAIFISLGTVALSADCQPSQGHEHPFAPWGQEPLLPLLPVWEHGHLLAPWGKTISASTGTCASSGCSGTGSSLPAWGHGHFQLLGDRSALCLLPACSGTLPCSGSLGTRSLSPAWGQDPGELLHNIPIENLLGDKNISAGSGTWASPWVQGPTLRSGGHGNLLAPWGQGGLCLLRNTDTFPCVGTEAPSTWDISCCPGSKIMFACLGTRP